MTSPVRASYSFDNTWDKAHRRLTLLETYADPATISRLETLGVGPGWRCLELGAGAGSIARWLCDRVGAEGTVAAVDLEPRFLEADARANMEIHRHDVVADGIPGAGYDLIHSRAFLMHIPQRERVIAQAIGALRPGGILLLEEGDAHGTATCASPIYSALWARAAELAAEGGSDWYWARNLPACLDRAGITDVEVIARTDIVRGGSPWAQMWAMSLEQLTSKLLEAGEPAHQVAAGIAELAESERWFPTLCWVSAWGRRGD